jgi:hypothetical protein
MESSKNILAIDSGMKMARRGDLQVIQWFHSKNREMQSDEHLGPWTIPIALKA